MATLFSGLLLPADLFAFDKTVNVVDQNGTPLVAVGFRWLLEEDNTLPVTLNTFSSTSLSVSIPKSHAPVVAAGSSADSTELIAFPDATKRYILSVMPDSGYTMSAANVAVGTADPVNVTVQQYPLPTAQISVFVFEDIRGISGIWDIIAEKGLPNFAIHFFDYLGEVTFDLYNNTLGTTYVKTCGIGGNEICFDLNGDPVVDVIGNGVFTDATGFALVKNIPPGIYTVTATPRDGQPWIPTVAIGGGPKIPAWVKAGEPPFFTQAGLLNMHVYLGYVLPFRDPAFDALGGTGTITGRIVDLHDPKPPNALLPSGAPVPHCWVGLNSVETGQELGKLVQLCNANSTFTITGVPAGVWQLVASDLALDNLLDNRVVTLADGQTVNLGDVAIGRWFGTWEGSVFFDTNLNGFRNTTEVGIPDQVVTTRYRDGSIYQSTVTDALGNFILQEFTPFGRWLIGEVDAGEYKSTGATIVVDNGGVIPANNGWVMPSEGKRTPQVQAVNNPNTGNKLSRTETGRVLTEGIIVNFAQNHRTDWGKALYPPGQTGGISGVVCYGTTRAEDDPKFATCETWDPGVPGVTVNVYADVNGDGSLTGQPVIATTTTSSSDITLPTGCPGPAQLVNSLVDPQPAPVPIPACAETVRTWNQVRPSIYDGRYYVSLGPGAYVVEVIPPLPYIVQKSQDKNIDFGDEFVPSLLPYECVGAPYTVPDFLSLFPDQMVDAPLRTSLTGNQLPLCDKKRVTITSGQNAITDFSIFTEVPKAGRIVGIVQNLFANSFYQYDPNFGGAQGMPWMPVSIKDFAGKEITRVHTDEWGAFNALVPGSNRANVLTPSGFSPNIVTVCSNSPASDPQYNPDFGEICLNLEAFPGKTAYILVPINANRGFVGSQTNLDCEFPDMTPEIASVSGPTGGPYVSATGQTIHITSVGTAVPVPNPNYPDVPGSTPTINRDFGFGPDTGTRSVTVGGTLLAIVSWSPTDIMATVPAGVTTGELIVTRGDNNRSTIVGITLNVGAPSIVKHVPGDYATIQAAIDAASDGWLILVGPKLVPPFTYNENIIMPKNVMLQGSGASTIINASTCDAAAWTAKITDPSTGLVATGAVSLVQNQRADFHLEQCAGITVLGDNDPGANFIMSPHARIDGFTITGAIGANSGGGIFVNGYAHYLEISNNIIMRNQGNISGGIRLGWSDILDNLLAPNAFIGSSNDNISVHHNHINRNGAVNHGAGISIFAGSDNYAVTENDICGNYSGANGAGLAHFGLSDHGVIADNTFRFNEGFGEGGGASIMGQLIPPGFPNDLTPGAGNVTVNANLFQGNLGGDDAGAVNLASGSGQDVFANLGNPAAQFHFNITNNIMANNLAGFSGGAMNLTDTVNVNISHNTIVRNDSMGTACVFVNAGLTNTTPMTGGIQLLANGATFADLVGEFSPPVLYNNILYQNRSFFFRTTLNNNLGGLLPNPVSPYWDLQVVGTAAPENMNPMSSIMTYTTDPFTGFTYNASNIAANPLLVNPYFNVIKVPQGANACFMFPTITPLTPTGDYHIVSWSPARDSAAPLTPPNFIPELGIPELTHDYDGDVRPLYSIPDRGADEYYLDPVLATTGIFSISGKVQTKKRVGIPGVQMIVVTSPNGGAAGMATTNAAGNYTIPGLANGKYTLTPVGPGIFNPTSITVTINNGNLTVTKITRN